VRGKRRVPRPPPRTTLATRSISDAIDLKLVSTTLFINALR
jgi:hypothetical protein